MEPRFGHSFERVRIHTDASAAQSAQALNARAYTTGRHIVFGAGRYAPQTPKGQRLLAHELTHTLQQSAAGSRSPVIQREPDGPDAQEEKPTGTGGEAAADRKDIVFVMDSTFTSAAQLFSPGAALFEVDSPEVMTKHLEDFGSPIGTLFVLAHSMSNAEIKFDSTGWISADDLAAKLKGRIDPTRAPKALDLRGCSIGMNPTGMDELRQAVGADSVIGATCFMNIYRTHSVQLDGTPITKKSQLKKAGYKAAFNLHFKELPKQFGDAKKCIVDPTQKGYFQAGGHLVSIYTTKTLGAAYSDTHSVCYKDLPTATLTPDQVAAGKGASSGDCQLLKVDIAATPPPPASPSTTGKGAEETEVIPSEPAPLEEDLEEEG